MGSLGSFEVAARKAEGAEADTFMFCGETFTVADKVGIIPLGRFAKAAQAGVDTAEMEGLAAMIDMLGSVVVDEDRERFLELASRKHADADDLMPIVQAVIEAQGNPTESPSASSDGQSTTGTNSVASPISGAMTHQAGDPRANGLESIDQAALKLMVG